jgi:hypothetical protein
MMYHEEMQVKFEYGCCPIIIGGVIALGLRKRIENDSFRPLQIMRSPTRYLFVPRESRIKRVRFVEAK